VKMARLAADDAVFEGVAARDVGGQRVVIEVVFAGAYEGRTAGFWI